MKLHFEPNLDYQHAAIESVCDLFRGQEICRTEFTVTVQSFWYIKGQEEPPLSGRIARTLFAVESGVMVLLHGFIKKTRATPQAEIDLAEKRFKEWKHGEK